MRIDPPPPSRDHEARNVSLQLTSISSLHLLDFLLESSEKRCMLLLQVDDGPLQLHNPLMRIDGFGAGQVHLDRLLLPPAARWLSQLATEINTINVTREV